LTGYSAEEVIGRTPRILRSGSTTPEQYQHLWETIRQGNEWQGEIEDRKKNGELYWALQAISPLRDAAGNVTHYLAVQQDITEQKRDKEALRESEERFRHIADMAGEWLWEQDAEGRYLYSSSAVRNILGYRPDEIIEKHYLDLLTPEDRARWSAKLAAGPGIQKRFHRLINHYRHKDGREVFTESTGEPIFDAEGRLVKWRGVDHDITARKRYEDALRLRDRAIEAASVGINISDACREGYPNIYVNPALSRITGYSREELLGINLRFLQGPGTDPNVLKEIRQALIEGRYYEAVLKNYRKDGTPFWNELLLSPVRDVDGKLTHYIGIHTDVTERRKAEEERHELEIAKHIQLSLLPKKSLRLEGLEVAGLCLPVGHVGGDYFDYFPAGDSVDVVIADVSGHNVGAALIMTEARSTLKAETRKTREGHAPRGAAEILGILNELLYEDLAGTDLFITMFYLKYDLFTRRLRYANAGHHCALLTRANESGCISLDADGLILGVKRTVSFEEKSLLLRSGDVVLLYTDGVTEASNERGEFFGLPRLCRALTAHHDHAPRTLIDNLVDELRAFCGNREFQDDISMVVLKVL
jgi:sigma-B regulation protein RsbU (phosphoserine phosphatase)